MIKRLMTGLIRDHPDYADLHNILSLAAETWPRFGISAGELSEMDDLTLGMLRIIVFD